MASLEAASIVVRGGWRRRKYRRRNAVIISGDVVGEGIENVYGERISNNRSIDISGVSNGIA